MNQYFTFLSYALAHWQDFLGAIAAVGLAFTALVRSLVVFFQMIPGRQPEAFLQGLADRFQTYVDAVEKHSAKRAPQTTNEAAEAPAPLEAPSA